MPYFTGEFLDIKVSKTAHMHTMTCLLKAMIVES
jgi:hypothetical protein